MFREKCPRCGSDSVELGTPLESDVKNIYDSFRLLVSEKKAYG